MEPVLETAPGEWTFTGNSYDYLEIDTEYFPSIEAILAYLDNPTPTGYAYPSEVAGESFPIYFLSSAQLLDLTELSDQPSGNYALWDGGGWIDLEPVLMDGAGTWTLTEDEEDYLEVDSAQFSSFQSVIVYLLDPTPQGHLLLDPNPTSPDIGDASPDAGYSSPDSGTISPDDSYYSEGDGFADGDYPDIPYPDDPYHSGGDGFLGDHMDTTHPDDHHQSGDDGFADGDYPEIEEPEPTVPFAFELVDHIDPFDAGDLAQLVEGYQEIFFQSFVIPDYDSEYHLTEFHEEPTSDFLPGEDPLVIEQGPEIVMAEDTYFETDQEFGSEPTFEYPEAGDYLIEYGAQIIWTLSIEGFKDDTRPDLVVDMEGNVYAGDFEAYWRDAHDVGIEDPEWSESSYSADPEGIENLYASHPEIFGSADPVFVEGAKPAIVRTMDVLPPMSGTSMLTGQVMAMGDSELLEVGFLASSHFDGRDFIAIPAQLDQETMQFSVSLAEIDLHGTIYYRAYAVNEAGHNHGSVKIIEIETFQEADPAEGFMEEVDWFGDFVTLGDSDWIFHSKLQWLYAHPDHEGGLWLWKPGHGWLWTQDGVWPFLYEHETGRWLYLLSTEKGGSFFFDYEQHRYFPALQEE